MSAYNQYRSGKHTIYHGDFIAQTQVEAESVDLFVTSPPYNVGIEYDGHDDAGDYGDYLTLSNRWLGKAHELAAADGRLCLNIPLDRNYGGHQAVYADLVSMAIAVGWRYRSTICWNKVHLTNNTAWGSWMSASSPNTIAQVEMIAVFSKGDWKKLNPENRPSDIERDEFMAWTNGVWSFNGESATRIGHPAPFPRELPKRCIKLFSFVGDTVCDPFLGSGTTLIEAHDNQRVGIGFEQSESYFNLAVKRFDAFVCQPRLL